MKKVIFAIVGALALGGCGDLWPQNSESPNGMDKGHINALAYRLTGSLLELDTLSGGLPALVGRPMKVPIGLGTPLPAAAPRLLQSPLTCESSEGESTRLVVKDDFGPLDEELKSEITLTYQCIDDVAVIGKLTAEVNYKDGSVGEISVQEKPGDTMDGNLLTGFVELKLERNFPADDPRESLFFRTGMSFGGSFEAALPNERRVVDFSETVIKMRTGTTIVRDFNPEEPWAEDEEPGAGFYKRTITYASGPLLERTDEVKISSPGFGKQTSVIALSDGGHRTKEISVTEAHMEFFEVHSDGFEKFGTYALDTGQFYFQSIFPEGHGIFSVDEAGTWSSNSAQGDYARTLVFSAANRSTEHMNIELSRQGEGAVRAAFTIEGEEYLLGSAVITRTAAITHSNIRLENGVGDEVLIDELRYPDGTATQTYLKDDTSTQNINPDEEGELAFAADGSGAGSVKVYSPGNDADFTRFAIRIGTDGTVDVRRTDD